MANYSDVRGPRVVAHNLASSTNDFIIRLQELGFAVGPDGASMNPELAGVVDAMFHVLAGGEVEIRVTHRGNPDIVSELERRIKDSVNESNEINKNLNFYLTISG
jgi:hypothetical protein